MEGIMHRLQVKNTGILAAVSWLLALVWSIPQLAIFRTVDISQPDCPSHQGRTFFQCSDIWQIRGIPKDQLPPVALLHQISHLILVFWLPVVILAVAYVVIAAKLLQMSMGAIKAAGGTPGPSTALQSFRSSTTCSSRAIRGPSNEDGE